MGNTNEDRYLSERGFDEYDALLKQYIDSEETLAYKTVLKSTDANENTLLLFFRKPNATLSDTPDKTITITGGGGAGGGHVIINAAGTALPQEDNLQFAGYLQTTDDSTHGKTVVDDSPTEVEYSVWQTMTTAQKEGKKWIILNYPGGGGGSGGGHIIVDATGTALPQQSKLQFGDYLKATNDSTNGTTKVEDNVETITWTDYQALTDAQRAGRHFIITGAPTPTLEATRVTYDNTGSGTSADNVQDAIDDKANRNDLTSINETGSTASQAISNGTYFYLNGTLVRAKTNIASGATFTENTNYEIITAGGLNELTKNVCSNRVELTNTLPTTNYTMPADGYVYVSTNNTDGNYGSISFFDSSGTNALGSIIVRTPKANAPTSSSCFLRKGMIIKNGGLASGASVWVFLL